LALLLARLVTLGQYGLDLAEDLHGRALEMCTLQQIQLLAMGHGLSAPGTSQLLADLSSPTAEGLELLTARLLHLADAAVHLSQLALDLVDLLLDGLFLLALEQAQALLLLAEIVDSLLLALALLIGRVGGQVGLQLIGLAGEGAALLF